MTTAEQDLPLLREPQTARVTCVEIGGSTIETVILEGDELVHRSPLAHAPTGQPLLIAVPGLVSGKRVLAATNLEWFDVDPAVQLGLDVPVDLVCNDAEAAALGESVLRPGHPDLVFVGLGTGVGGAVVRGGAAEANLFAHGGDFGTTECTCNRLGCLETVVGGWALPEELSEVQLVDMAKALATAIDHEPLASPKLVVLAGGMTSAHPSLVGLLATALPERVVVGTAAPHAKSAAAWGLRYLFSQRAHAVTHL